jgi:hypothetical protein
MEAAQENKPEHGGNTEAGRRGFDPRLSLLFSELSAATIPAVSVNFQVDSQRPASLVSVLSNPRCGSSLYFIAPHRGEAATWAGLVGVVAILPRMTVLVPILILLRVMIVLDQATIPLQVTCNVPADLHDAERPIAGGGVARDRFAWLLHFGRPALTH